VSGTRGRSSGGRRRGYERRSPWRGRAVAAAAVLAVLVLGYFAADSFGVFRASAGQVMPDQGRGQGHVATGQKVAYNSTPPTSGPHWDTPASWGVKKEHVEDERIVHNLEHGGVAIAYFLLDQATLERLTGLANSLPREKFGEVKVVVHPDDRLKPGEIVLTAWARMDRLPSFDEERIRRFYDAHVDRGPELVP
jgi:hypothetical protein